jgi:hypothetical protein
MEPRPLRAHMALCLLGFRGSGYSPAFVEEMGRVQAALRADPGRPVRLVAEPDPICEACPNLTEAGCALGGPGHEAHMHAHDTEVLRRLGLAAGETTTWAAVLERIRGRIRGADLPAICTTCPWLPLGVCAASVDALRAAEAPAAADRSSDA